MESQHRRELNFQVNAAPAVDAPWRATALPTLQHPSVPSESSHRHPDPRQLHDYTGVVQDESVSD